MNLLTIKAIAQSLDVPESNLRYYVTRYGDYIPAQGEGRKRRYLPQAQDVFARIIELIDATTSPQEIEQVLASEFTRDVEVINDDIAKATTNQQQYHIELLINKISDLSQDIKQIKQIQQEDRMAMLEHYRLVDERLRQQQHEKHKRKWYWPF
jgi:DNA-binding transcriptional MerR regulator